MWDAAEEALYAQMNILPFAATTAPIFGNGAEFAARPTRDDRHQPASRWRPSPSPSGHRESGTAAGSIDQDHGTDRTRDGVGESAPLAGVPDPPRLARLVASLFLLITISFAMIHAIPGDPVRTALGGITAQPELVAARRHDLGLDQPLGRAVRRLPRRHRDR